MKEEVSLNTRLKYIHPSILEELIQSKSNCTQIITFLSNLFSHSFVIIQWTTMT